MNGFLTRLIAYLMAGGVSGKLALLLVEDDRLATGTQKGFKPQPIADVLDADFAGMTSNGMAKLLTAPK